MADDARSANVDAATAATAADPSETNRRRLDAQRKLFFFFYRPLKKLYSPTEAVARALRRCMEVKMQEFMLKIIQQFCTTCVCIIAAVLSSSPAIGAAPLPKPADLDVAHYLLGIRMYLLFATENNLDNPEFSVFRGLLLYEIEFIVVIIQRFRKHVPHLGTCSRQSWKVDSFAAARGGISPADIGPGALLLPSDCLKAVARNAWFMNSQLTIILKQAHRDKLRSEEREAESRRQNEELEAEFRRQNEEREAESMRQTEEREAELQENLRKIEENLQEAYRQIEKQYSSDTKDEQADTG